ncbi:hypothetical protein V6N13_119413 [Hibiscus sabdariffa]
MLAKRGDFFRKLPPPQQDLHAGMANGTRSSSRKAKDDENNDLKGSQNNGKKSVNLGAASAEASGVRRSPRETLSKKNMTPPSSFGTRKSERLEKQTSILNSTTPPAKRKTERVEKKKGKKNDSPLRRSERGKMSSSSASSGSKRAHKSLDVLNTKRKKEKKSKCVKQLTMQTVEVNKIEQEDEQAEETQKKRMTARSYRALFSKQPKKVDGTDCCSYLSGTDSERRDEDILEEFTERTCERTTVTITSQFAEEKLKRNDEHTLLPTSQKNNCKNMSFDGGDPKMYVSVEGETNNDAETTELKNLQNSQLVNSIMPGGVLDCDISVEMVLKVEPSERKVYDIDIDSAASPKMSSNDIGTCTGSGTSLSSGCKRKDCTETCGMCSKRQRVDCNSTKPGICSSNMKLNQFFGSSDVMDRGKLDAGISTGHIEKPGNHIQQHTPSADLQSSCVQNTCIICRLDGKLLCCHGKGCQRSYHLSCLEPPLEEFHLGAWYCQDCVRKKLESGVYSVSEGVEAIWDSRELEDSEDGLQGQKQYFVKYKGLAHVHNHWVPEKQVLLEAPSLIAKYNGKNQGTIWKQQWAVPRRLLQKRLLTTPKECDEHHNEEHDVDKLKCHVEWLVKWCGLGYEHASWELENASFFSCPEGRRLIREYETRKKAQRASKFDKERAVASLNFSHLPATVSSGLDANLDAVNKLCNHWCRNQNAIIFDDQERISNVISSILAFSSEISRPFLIISSSASQYSWDEEFFHLAPSVDVVVYNGSKEIRNSISNLEFYDEGSCIMFQVLITSPEVISEDLDVLDCIGWEAIVVDECQCPRIGSCFEQIKMLTASKRILIISSQLKDNVAEYLNLLSLLDSQSDSNDTELMNSSDNIDTLKERLSKFVAYECKLESSRFLEYWVPVLLSNVQLEKYCFTLASNSLSLCSPSKTDPVGVLRSILVSSRKCCDHPYDVDQSLQMLLTKGLQESEFLEVGIKASGKLQVLDSMLWEIKKRELKVLILFQYIGGSGRDMMGDILDDFLRQRFGIDSYERFSNGVTPSKKQSALNRFNNESERFVFLLETRACLPSIKLSAVGTVIIFGSDWSPSNDLRALQRINIDSQFEQIKVFRLYSPFTVEEKLLMLSKQDKAIDSNVENISPSISHMLLKWGASYLFSQLENFHDISTPDASTLSQKSHLKDVIQEFFTILLHTGIDDTSKLSLILRAKQKQGMHRTDIYRTEMPLFGEQKIQVMNEDSAHTFWTKLLEGKCPRWKYSTNTSQRNRKRIQYFDELQNRPQAETAEITKRRKKFVSDGNDHPSQKTVLQEGKLAAGDREGRSVTSASGCDKIQATSSSLHEANNISKTPALKMVEWESRRKQRDSQKNLHVLLRPQIAELCEILHLTEDVKAMVERFLEYVMNNHLVHREPATILQAFQISLCWSAAALLKQKLDHKESLALAKQHLGFACKKEEADYVYSLLRCLKRMFLYRTGYLKVPNSPKASGLSSKAVERDYSNTTSYQQNIKATVEDLSGFREGCDIQTISESGVAPEIQLAQRDLIKSIKEIQKKCDKLMKKQIEMHKREMEQFNQKYEEEKAQLENKKRTEAAVIRLHSNVSTRTNKLKSLDTEYARKFNELERQMDIRLKDLKALQVAARINVQERKTRWVESVKSWARDELVKSPVSEANLSEGRSSGIFQSDPGSEVRPPKIVHIVDDEVIVYSDPINKAITFKEKTEGASIECNLAANSGGGEQVVSRDSCLRELDSVDGIPNEGVLVDVPVTTSSADVTENVFSMRFSEYQISDGSKAYMSDCETNKELPLKAAETETVPGEVLKGGSVQRENDGTSPVENDRQDGVLCTMNRESELQEPSSVLVSTDAFQARCLANSEMQNASHAGAIDVTCNDSDPNVTVVELTEQVQQLRCSESTSSLSPPDLPSVSAVEPQSNNEGQTANHSSQAPRQPVENHIELSNQDVLQPLDSPICGIIEGLVNLASETRTAPIPSVSNGLPLQTAPAVSSRMPMAMYHDPLQTEIERIMKEKEQTPKIHEDTKLQLKLDCDKEIEEAVAQIRRKYEVKLKEKEAEFLIRTKELDVTYNKVLLNKILAEAFRSKCIDSRASGSAGAVQVANSSALQQLFQRSSQQMVQQPSTASGLPSTVSALSTPTVSSAAVNSQTMSTSLQPSTASGIPSNGSAISMQNVSPAVVNAQTMGPPLQVVNPSALFSGTLTRPPHISAISSSIGNLQIGTEVRAPAPHLQPFRPSSSISPSSFPLRSGGMSVLQAHNNHPAASLSLCQSYVSPNVYRKASTTAQSGRTQHEIARGLTAPPNSRLTSLDVLMGVNDPSGANANPPGFLLSNSSSRSAARFHGESHLPSSQSNSAQEATDIVCLSDDD